MTMSFNGVAARIVAKVIAALLLTTIVPLASQDPARAEVAEPVSIHVSITGDWIEFFNFTPGELVDVTVDGQGIGSVVAEGTRFVGEFDFDLAGGQHIVAEQGANVVAFVLSDLGIDIVGKDAFGYGPANTELGVEVVGSDCGVEGFTSKPVSTDGAGDWGTTFETECPGETPLSGGSVFHFADGNATIAETAEDPGGEGGFATELEEDLTLTEDHEGGIAVMADGITLDCDGHRIHGGDDIGILLAGRNGVTVTNCVIEGFFVSILLEESHDNTLRNNTSRHPAEWGFALFFSSGNLFDGNTAVSSNSNGYVVVGSANNRFVDNSGASDGGHTGFSVLSSSDNEFVDNDVRGYDFGFTVEAGWWEELFEGSDDNTFNGNEVNGNGFAGFLLAKADGNLLSENNVEGSFYGILLIQATDEGVPLEGHYATNNTFKENRIRGNAVGYVNVYVSANLVVENTICHNDENIGAEDTATVFQDNKYCGA